MMKLLLRKNILVRIVVLLMLCSPIYLKHIEPWIDSGDLFTIKINMTSGEVIEKLGDPLYIDAHNDEDEQIITKNLYYNYRTKKYETGSGDKALIISENAMSWGRTTILQFTFIENQLVGWEEDKLTLNMAYTNDKDDSILKYFSIILNIITAIKVFGV